MVNDHEWLKRKDFRIVWLNLTASSLLLRNIFFLWNNTKKMKDILDEKAEERIEIKSKGGQI